MPAIPQLLRTPEEIADALGVELTPAFGRDLKEFAKWKDFPKQSAEGLGYEKDEVLAFIERNKLKIASRKATAQLLKGDSKTTASDLKLIQIGATGEPRSENLGQVDTLTAMAHALEKHYHGRVHIQINKSRVNDWRHNRLPVHGAPVPPGKIKDSPRYDVGEWVTWFDRWLLEHYKLGNNAELDNESAKLESEQRKNELEQIEHDRFERAVARGKYIERELSKRTLIGALKQFHGMVKAADERNAPVARLNKLKELGVTMEQAAAFHAFDLALARDITDSREESCKTLGSEQP